MLPLEARPALVPPLTSGPVLGFRAGLYPLTRNLRSPDRPRDFPIGLAQTVIGDMGERAVGIPNGIFRASSPSCAAHPWMVMSVTLCFHDFHVERMSSLGEDDHADIWGSLASFPDFMRLQVDRACSRQLAFSGTRPIVAFPSERSPHSPELLQLKPLQRDPGSTHFFGLLGPWPLRDDHADIVGIFGKFPPFMRLQVDRGFARGACFFLGPDPLLLFHPSRLIPTFGGVAEIDLGVIPTILCETVRSSLPYCARPCGLYLIVGDRERGSRCSAHSSFSSGSAVTCSISTASRLLITLRGIRLLGCQQCGSPGLIVPSSMMSTSSWGGVWGCTGYYPSLALRQFGGVKYPPRLGDLDAVTFDYIPSEDMPTVRPGTSHSLVSRSLLRCQPPLASTGQPERVTVLERELEKAQIELLSLRLARAAEREASAARVESLRSILHHNSVAVANLPRLEALLFAREQLETEQAERTRVQDELDSLRSYTQALVDPATGRPQDIVALRRALDAIRVAGVGLVHDALESNASWLNQEGFPVVTSLHQINQVMDSLGARARAVWEEHDEGDPALSTALGRFCRETCIRLGH
uniref:Uncharacterized protein n=1 Tax=Fagus sylvatica TaxID=28930 RepID=A0A2N9EZC9_FAGSY